MKSQKDKQQLRKDIALLKSQHSKDILSERSEKICRKLEENDLFLNASCVALYYAIPGEVQTEAFIEKWYCRKKIVLPVIHGDQLEFIPYTGKECLVKGKMNIPEPDAQNILPVSPDDIDLIIVPGVAFDRQLNRMGRGKGYYDRLLAFSKASRIGICYGFQLFDKIPTDPHDSPMHIIITEEEAIQ